MGPPAELEERISQLRDLAKARTATDFARRSPKWLCDVSEDEPAAVLSRAIDAVDDPVFRNAARALFPLPYDVEVGSLTERRSLAAESFHVGPSTFRTPTRSRKSYEQQVLDAVLQHVGSTSPGSTASNERNWPTSRRKPAAVAAATLVAILMVAAVAVLLSGADDEPSGEVAVGQVPSELPQITAPTPPAEAETLRPTSASGEQPTGGSRACPGDAVTLTPARQARVEAQLRQLGWADPLCQDIPAKDRWGMTVVKYLSSGGATNWVDVEYPDGRFLIVPEQAWSAYRGLRKEDADDDTTRRPLSWSIDRGGRSELLLDGGAVVVGSRWWLPHYTVSASFVGTWRAEQDRLGDPMEDVSALGQAFEFGRLRPSDRRIISTYSPGDEIREALPSEDDLANSVMRQEGGPAWFIDAAARRWWIPDDATYGCLATPDRTIHVSIPPSQVASLELAGWATCGFAGLG